MPHLIARTVLATIVAAAATLPSASAGADVADRTGLAAQTCPTYSDHMTYPIQLCDSGDAVRLIQYRLRQTSPGVQIDGRFGPRTRRAVIRYQEQMGLTVDGIVGPKTWLSLVGYGSPSDTDTNGNGFVDPDETTYIALGDTSLCARFVDNDQYPITRCDQGPAVRVIQAFLSGPYQPWIATVDGRFGRNTDYALRFFQHEMGRRVDGLVGPRTWKTLVINAGFSCGVDDDGSGMIDPDEITSEPRDYASVAAFLEACGTIHP